MVFLLTLFGYIKSLQKKETWSIKDWMVEDQRNIITWIYKFIFILLLSYVAFVINALKNHIHSVVFTIQTKVKCLKYLRNIQFSSITQSCLTLYDPMDCSTPGLPVYHQLPEFTQTHVHWEKAMATHSSTLAWKIAWMEQPGRLQSMGLLRVGHNWAAPVSIFTFNIGEGNGNPLQGSCLENPWDRGAWWAAIYGVAQSWTQLKWLSSSMSIGSVMPSNHLILCHPLLLPPSIFSQHQGLFQWVNFLHQMAKVLEFQLQHQSF